MSDDNVICLEWAYGRHGQDGLYSLKDLPQQESIEQHAVGTGWSEMDQLLKFYPGQFVMISGIAGHGKSTFAMNLICNLAHNHGMRSFMCVPENERHVWAKMQKIWGVRRGFEYFESDQCFVQSFMTDSHKTPPKTLDWVLDQAIVAIEHENVDVLLIDPWNELERAKPKDQLMTDYIGQCLMYLKQFSRVHNVVVMLIAHPTKAGIADNKIPGLSDIEGSLAWHNKCDNGLIVHRHRDTDTCQVISAKVREIGAGRRGVCHFSVDPYSGLFTPQLGGVSCSTT